MFLMFIFISLHPYIFSLPGSAHVQQAHNVITGSASAYVMCDLHVHAV